VRSPHCEKRSHVWKSTWPATSARANLRTRGNTLPHVFGRTIAGALNTWAAGLIEKRIATFEARTRRVAKRGLDGEALHDLRTAARRLRGALEDVGALVPYSRRNLRLVKRVGDATGEARDLAVLIGRLQTYRALAGQADRAEIDGLVATLERRERRALKHAKTALKDCTSPKHPPADGEATPLGLA
jgi:hypothetical protein